MKQYTESAKKQMEWKVPFRRDDAFPLDRSTIFTSYEELLEYASSYRDEYNETERPHSKGIPYVGQVVTVSTNTGVTVYKIEGIGSEDAAVVEIENKLTANNTIDIDSGNTISVKIRSHENFIGSDDEGIFLNQINTNKTVVDRDITINGGPLASYFKTALNTEVISANTDITTLLEKLVCTEKFPTPSYNKGTFEVTVGSLTINNTNNIRNNDFVEVGTVINFSKVNSVDASTAITNPSVSNLTYGYSPTTNVEDINTGKTISTTWTSKLHTTNNYYTLTASTTGFTGNFQTVSTGTTSCSLSACTLTVGVGPNQYYVKETSPTYLGSHNGIGAYYIVSNLNTLDSGQTTTAITSQIDFSDNAIANTTFKVTGVYPIFTNGVTGSTDKDVIKLQADLTEPTSTTLPLSNYNSAFAISFPPQYKEGFVIEMHTSYTIDSAYVFNTLNNDWNETTNYASSFNKTVVEKKVQGVTVKYHKYTMSGEEGSQKYKFVIKK